MGILANFEKFFWNTFTKIETRLVDLFKGSPDKFLSDCTGVILVGANSGEEASVYAAHDLHVVWIEPIPEIFEKLKQNIAPYPKQRAINRLVTDKDGSTYKFNISGNDGMSSSIFDMAKHKEMWPNVSYVRSEEFVSTTLSNIIEKENLDMSDHDALVMDTQGSELLVLMGAEKHLKHFRFIKTEAADFEAYRNCARLDEITGFLKAHGFRLYRKVRFKTCSGIGSYFDAIYVR